MAVYQDKKTKLYWIKGKAKLPNGTYKDYERRWWKRKKDALQAELNLKEAYEMQKESITFKQLVAIYFERSPIMNVKEATLFSDESYYRIHLADFFDDMELEKITPKVIELWKLQMIKKRKPDGSPYSTTTINNTKQKLSKFLTYAERMDYIDSNPCRKVPNYVNPNERKDKDLNFWEVDDFKRFISVVDQEDWNLVFTFLFMTGLREGEFAALTWKDLDFKTGKLRVDKTVSYKTAQTGYAITTPKTKNSIRTIDINTDLLERLKERFERVRNIDGFSYDFFIFGSDKPIARTSLARELDRCINLSGVKRITPHGFRHSHASALIKMKIDDSTIAERLGHTVNELRKTYAHVYQSSREDLSNKLNDLL